METIAQSVVDGVSYDKTILCTIVDDADRDNGNYRVSDGTSNFWAYSETKTFRNDEQVYVTIPNGDYSLQKLIIGKKKETEEEAFNYVKPFENLMQCTPNLGAYLTYNAGTAENPDYQALNSNYFSLIANGKTTEKLASLSNEVDISRYFQGFTRLGIRARFRSMLAAEQVASGNYGLAFIFTTRVLDVVDGNTFVYETFESLFGEELVEDSDFTEELKWVIDQYGNLYSVFIKKSTDSVSVSLTIGSTSKTLQDWQGLGYRFFNKTFDTIEDYQLNDSGKFVYYILDNNYIKTAITPELNPGNIQLYVRKNVYKEEQKIFKLQVEDMIGNPYAFETYFSQEKVFDVSDVQNVTKLEVKFFQDKNFINKTGNAIAISEFANLFCSDVEFYFGYDLSDIDGEYVQLFTYDPLTYESSDNILDNQKTIYLRWAHQDGDKTTVFDQDNLEEWYDEFLDSEENPPSYEFKLDGSLEQVENREYYQLTDIYDEQGDLKSTLKFYIDVQESLEDNPVTYDLLGFYPAYNITKCKQYFRKETIPLKDLWDDSKVYKSYFIDEKNNIVNDNLFNYADGNLFKQRKRVPVILTSEGQLKADDTIIDQSFVSQHTFYTWDGQFIATTSILSPSELTSLLNDDKIIYTDTFGSLDGKIEEEFNIADSTATAPEYSTYDRIQEDSSGNIQYKKKENENEWVNFPQDTYISIYAPIPLTETWNGVADNADLNLALGLGQIYEAQFKSIISTGEANVESEKYVQNTSLFELVKGDFTYSQNTYYYKKYQLDQFEVRWYRYNLGYIEPDDEYCGVYWERLQPWSEENLTGVEHDEPPFVAKLIPDTVYNATEQIKVILLVTDSATEEVTPYYSNVLTFTNKNPVISVPTIQQELALRIKIDDNTSGNYYLYDESNSLIDASQGTQQRSLTVLFDKSNYSSQTRLENASEVTWIFPIENTMIKVDTSTTSGVYSETGNSYAQITTTEALNEYKLYYTIDKTYSYAKGNNTITCNIVKDGEHYSATQELSFGPSGSNGSDYTLVLDLLSADNMVTVNASTNLVGFVKESDILNIEDIPKDSKYYYLDLNTQTLRPIDSDGTALIYYQSISSYDEVLKYLEQGTPIYIYKNDKYELVSNSINEDAQYYIACEAEKYLKKDIGEDNDYILLKDILVIDSIDNNKNITYSLKSDFDKVTVTKSEFLSTYSVYYKDEQTDSTFYKPITIKTNDDIYLEKVKDKEDPDKIIGYTFKVDCYIKNVLEQIYGYVNKNNNSIYNVVNTSTPIETNEILATLYDQSNNKVNGNYTINWSLELSEDGIEKYFTFSSETTGLNETVSLLQNQTMTEPNVLCIVTATLTGFGDYDLVAHLPIPLRRTFGVTRYQGPTQIIYSATGYPNYYKNEINLFYNNIEGDEQAWPLFYTDDNNNTIFNFSIDFPGVEGQQQYLPTLNIKYQSIEKKYYVTEIVDSTYNQNAAEGVTQTALRCEEDNAVTWTSSISLSKTIYCDYNGTRTEVNFISTDSRDGSLIIKDTKNIPKNYYYIIENIEDENVNSSGYVVMTPKSIYVELNSPFGIQYKHNNIIEFIQPILNIQNRYFSSTINKWDESLSIDNDSNTILAKMIGAGSKDSENRFSGVILGNWTGNVNQNDGGTLSLADNIGLYGFHEGETSFGFTSAGLGFIGKAGHGRILLDGNNSVITSSNWVMNSTNNNFGATTEGKGLYMKIDDGFILMRREAKQNSPIIKLNVLANGGLDDYIDDSNLTDKEPYAIMSPTPGVDQDKDYPFVIAKDSKNFTKIGWNGNIYLGGTHTGLDENGAIQQDTGYISLNAAAEKYPFDINNHFAVAWNGALTITTGQITSKTEYANNVIAIDDQRTFSGGEDDDYKGTEINETDEDGNPIYYYNNTLSNKKDEKDQKNNVTTYDNNTMIPVGIDDNDVTIIAPAANKVKNPYDYSTLNTSFKGFYATPEGDLYLSRKLVIGSNFSANSDGYLKAHSALFDNCNANVFTVRYLPDGPNATISFGNENKVEQGKPIPEKTPSEEASISLLSLDDSRIQITDKNISEYNNQMVYDQYNNYYFVHSTVITDGNGNTSIEYRLQDEDNNFYSLFKLKEKDIYIYDSRNEEKEEEDDEEEDDDNDEENNNNQYTDSDKTKDKEYEFTIKSGAGIGQMGWIKGASSPNGDTYNLGFKSYDNCGIILESATNIRLSSGKGTNINELGNAYNNIYFEGGSSQFTNDRFILLQTLLNFQDNDSTEVSGGFYDSKYWNRGMIQIDAGGRLYQNSQGEMQFLVDYKKGTYLDYNSGSPTVEPKYAAQFLMRGKGYPATSAENSETINDGFIRLQLPGKVRFSLGDDPWLQYSRQNDTREYQWDLTCNYIKTNTGEDNGEIAVASTNSYTGSVSSYYFDSSDSDQGGFNLDVKDYDHVHIYTAMGVYLGAQYNESTTEYQSRIYMDTGIYMQSYTGGITLNSADGGGPYLALVPGLGGAAPYATLDARGNSIHIAPSGGAVTIGNGSNDTFTVNSAKVEFKAIPQNQIGIYARFA